MIAYYKTAETDPTLFKKEILNTAVFNPKDQNIQPQVTLTPNLKYTVEDLIDRMIIYSDNMAYNLLMENIDSETVAKVYTDLGIDIAKAYTDPTGNIISVSGYSSFFRVLFNSSYLEKDMSEKALKLLSQVKFKDALPAGVPGTITVSHKFGERQYVETGQKQFHDCGIVYIPQNPYLVCIMTRGKDFNGMVDTIKNISQKVYQHITDESQSN
jgi:beta-lactamase class A